MQKKYSCCFIDTENNEFSEEIKLNIIRMIDYLVEICNINYFLFYNLNPFENFIYNYLNKFKYQIKRIKISQKYENTLLKRNNKIKYYKKLIEQSDICIFIDKAINISQFSISIFYELLVFAKQLNKCVLFI